MTLRHGALINPVTPLLRMTEPLHNKQIASELTFIALQAFLKLHTISPALLSLGK